MTAGYFLIPLSLSLTPYDSSVKPKVIEPSQRINVWLFSVIFSLNIAIGNTSLRWVSVNFNQVSNYISTAAAVTLYHLYNMQHYVTSSITYHMTDYQVCRSLVPVIVLLISILYYKKSISYERKVAVLPIVVGVAMASYGEMSATAVGSIYTFLCIVLGTYSSID